MDRSVYLHSALNLLRAGCRATPQLNSYSRGEGGRRPRRSRLGYPLCGSRGVPVLVARASPVPSVVRGSLLVKFFSRAPCAHSLCLCASGNGDSATAPRRAAPPRAPPPPRAPRSAPARHPILHRLAMHRMYVLSFSSACRCNALPSTPLARRPVRATKPMPSRRTDKAVHALYRTPIAREGSDLTTTCHDY